VAAVWMRVRAELRARRRATLGLALLLGLMTGAATTAAVGARRTETAYPRFLERYRVWDLDLTTGAHPQSAEIFAIAKSLPQVETTFRSSVYPGTVRTASGKEVGFPDVFFIGEHDRVDGYEKFKVVEGRVSNPTAPDEAMVNYLMADRLAIRPDDIVRITLVGATDGETPAPPPQELTIRVTGIIAVAGQFETTIGSGFTTSFQMTPAFQQRWAKYSFLNDDNLGIRLKRGDQDAVTYLVDLRRELERRGLGDGLDGDPRSLAEETPGVQGLNRVPAVALWLLCGFIAITTIAVGIQLLAREMRVGSQDHPVLHALGLSRGRLFAISMFRALVIIGAGAAISVGVAFLLSPLTPVGLARIAEPDPGFATAPLVLGLGALTTLVLMSAAAALPAWTSARWASRTKDESSASNPRFLTDLLARTPLGLSARSGLSMAMQSGRGERAIPIRTAVLGTTMAVGALAAALTFSASLGYLIDEPKLAGYTWDAGAIAAAFDPESQPELIGRISRSVGDRFPSAKVWSGTVFSVATVDGIEVTGYVSGGPAASIIEGRAPRGSDEVAVDPRTLRQAHKNLGDRVQVAPLADPDEPPPPSVTMRVVGLFAVPRIPFQGVNPGQGVALTPAGLERVQPGSDYAEAVYIDFPPGVDFERSVAQFRAAAGGPDVVFAIVSRSQSATVGNVERISSLPTVLAAMMGLLGVATLAHALTTTIRRRRRDLAIFKTIGLVGRQVRGIVAWQSTALVVTSLLVGLPLGIAAGRWGWRLFAEQLAVVPVPVVPALVVVAVVVGAILAANLIAALPARVAARTQPALVLRTE
jgi:hypothetical protein